MKTLQELKTLAWKLSEMPEGLDGPKQLYFLTLRTLSANCKNGLIDQTQLKREAEEAEAAYWQWVKLIDDRSMASQFWERVSKAAVEFAKNYDMESADNFFRTVYDLKPDWRNPNG